LLSGTWSKERGTQKDFRSASPRFQGENLERNLALVDTLRTIADARSTNPAQLAIAWALSRGDDIVPLVGARRRAQLTDALAAEALTLSADELARIEAAIPPEAVAGTRYNEAQMAHLDSEHRTKQ
jgi:aryl-alcohol dehydrogenase-like predicted oxidoreductase